MSIKAGSEAHKELFCRQFIGSYQVFDAETLPWPDLDTASLARLRGVPFCQEVYHTERRAGAIVDAFTPQVIDPLVSEAVALQGAEESHHAKLIRVMIDTCRWSFESCRSGFVESFGRHQAYESHHAAAGLPIRDRTALLQRSGSWVGLSGRCSPSTGSRIPNCTAEPVTS